MRTLLAAVTLAALTAGAADAAGPMADRFFDMADRDGNGLITQAEIAEMRAMRFQRLDGNGDGRIGQSEIEQAAARMQRFARQADPAKMMRLDGDGDGWITRAEFVGRGMGPMGQRADGNGDGQISREEFERALEAWRNR